MLIRYLTMLIDHRFADAKRRLRDLHTTVDVLEADLRARIGR